MNKKHFFLVMLFVSVAVFAQKNKQKPLEVITYQSNVDAPLTEQERAFIDEVYGDYANELVYNSPQKLKSFKNILRNRVQVAYHPKKDLSSVDDLSTVPLVNSINTRLTRDTNITDNNFNVLKYAFGFFSRQRYKYYRVDNTQYLITILPQQ